MSLDLAPVRPWEWGDIDAYEWQLAKDVQGALKSGFADYQQRKADDSKMEESRLKLIEKHMGKTG